MPIDPRIALGVQPIQIESPLAMANQIAGLREAEQRNALVQRQIQAQERALTEQNALRRRIATPDFFKQPNALESLVGEFGRQFTEADLMTDPGYGFRLREGMRDLDRRLSAGGRMFSGGALKAGQQYGQELASQEYQNAFTRAMDLRMQRANALSGLYGGGLQATTGFSQDVGEASRTVGDQLTSAGAARASGYIGQANALNQALGMGLNYMNQRDLLNRIYPSGGGGGVVAPGASAGAPSPVYAGAPRIVFNTPR